MEGGITMATIITEASTVVTAALGWVGDVVDVIVATPLLMLFAVLPLVGLGVGLLRRMMSV